VGIVYCGPFAAAIDEGTRYGHEGYAVQVLHSGAESRYWVREFREYRAGCDCGWRGSTVHPPTDAGETAAQDEWDAGHLHPLIREAAAGMVVPATAVLDLIAELRRALADAVASRGADARLTDREIGRCEVVEALEGHLDEIAVPAPPSTAGAGTARGFGGAW
jgi:hypothetical protein